MGAFLLAIAIAAQPTTEVQRLQAELKSLNQQVAEVKQRLHELQVGNACCPHCGHCEKVVAIPDIEDRLYCDRCHTDWSKGSERKATNEFSGGSNRKWSRYGDD